MPAYAVERLLSSLADAGRELVRGRFGNRRRGPGDMALELLSIRGEASGAAIARELLDGYAGLDGNGRRGFFTRLAEEPRADRKLIEQAIEAYRANLDDASLARLRHAAAPPRLELFRRLNMAPEGTRRLVAMRADLLRLLPEAPELTAVDGDLQELLTLWFNPGFLTFRPIDWNSPASLLEKLIRYERVHKIPNLEALRRRLASDRRCFAFFHPALPDEPLIFVQVALVQGIAAQVQPLLDQSTPLLPTGAADTAIFYSISNCQDGLKGVSLGNFLIKMVVAALQDELPHVRTFSTLSPIPGFRRWLAEVAERSDGSLGPAERKAAATLEQPDWQRDSDLAERLRPILLGQCAHYLVREKQGTHPLDPVARFHLNNGARLERLNWLGDVSTKGIAESAGILANYRYDPARIEANHETYVEAGQVVHAPAVKSLLPRLPEAA